MEQTDKRAVECSVVRKWNEMGYEHLQMQFFVQNLSDRVAKAERGSKTLRDHMKIQTYAVRNCGKHQSCSRK